jgi:hypothetical protein
MTFGGLAYALPLPSGLPPYSPIPQSASRGQPSLACGRSGPYLFPYTGETLLPPPPPLPCRAKAPNSLVWGSKRGKVGVLPTGILRSSVSDKGTLRSPGGLATLGTS